MPDLEDRPTRTHALSDWLAWLEFLHPTEIDLGLERVAQVALRAKLLDGLPTIVTVAGTNGKGSVVAMLTSIYRAAGYHTGSYTSPHLFEFNERIALDGKNAPDQMIVDSLDYVESHRADTSLTYFEYTTLAAMHVFIRAEVDVVILEVGLGGRLDAVNIWDTDCAVLTSVAIDHESWLGIDRESIGAEKVAVARAGRPLIVAETDPPESVVQYALGIGADYRQVGRDYDYTILRNGWLLNIVNNQQRLPTPALAGPHQYGNAAAAGVAIDSLQAVLPVSHEAISTGLEQVRLPGRFDRRHHQGVEIIVDVAHNPAAAQTLATALSVMPAGIQAHAVIAIMADKDVDAVIALMAPCITRWYCAQLGTNRALPAADLASRIIRQYPGADVAVYPGVGEALVSAVAAASGSSSEPAKRQYVLVFGSFYTVTEIKSVLSGV